MNSTLKIGIVAGAMAGATVVACSTSSAGGGSGGQYGSGGSGGVVTGGAYGTGATGGGVSTGGVSTGGKSGTGGGNTGGVGATGGGSNVTLPTGCVTNSAIQVQCNPVTNEGCTGAGEACDLGQDEQKNPVLGCFPPPNDVAPNGSCSYPNGPYCQPKYRCDQVADAGTGTCKKFCCTSADCGGSGSCVAIDAQIGTLGVCK